MRVIDNQLVPVYETDKGNKVVDARELHEFLGSKQDFTNWIKNRIEKYGFVMNEDFSINLSKSTGGRPSTDYILTIDTAKELAMVESNAKGRKVRKYFIEVEKRASNQPQIALPQNYVEALKALVMEMKLFEVKVTTRQGSDGTPRQQRTSKITGKGQIYFLNKFKPAA